MIEVALQQKMLNTLVSPGGYTIALFTANGGTEVSGGGYARRPVTFAVQNLPPLVARNSTSALFGPATTNWGQITHVGVYDSSGVLCLKRPLTNPVTVTTNGTYTVPVQTLEVGFV